jgi:CheY-like chemotaxis protein
MATPRVPISVPTGPKDLHDFFRCCERLLDNAADLTPFSEEDRKRTCFYTNEIAKLTERLAARSNGNRTRVLLVDDESLVRRILKQILASYRDVELVGEAATGHEAVAAVERLQPDIVVMDIRMPGMDGIAAAREIRAKYPRIKIIGLSEYAHSYNTDAMEQAGAVGVYLKSMALEDLYPAIKAAHPAI